MKLGAFIEKYDIIDSIASKAGDREFDADAEILADILDLDLTGLVRLNKTFELRPEDKYEPPFEFTAEISVNTSVLGTIERAMAPSIIKVQNKSRRTDKETLTAAVERINKMPKVVPISITRPNTREWGGSIARNIEACDTKEKAKFALELALAQARKLGLDV